MWYKNIAGRFFGLVTKHACDRRTDKITTPKTALNIARAVKTGVRMKATDETGPCTTVKYQLITLTCRS